MPESLQQSAPTLAFREAALICDADVEQCRAIGLHGLEIIRQLSTLRGRTVNVLTHCNAGWLACVDWGTALSPIYMAHDAGIPVHVWVDETRPRNQGAALTAFELGAHGVPHTVIADNLGGHLMQRGQVDMVIVGSDRTTAAGDVCNKVGTYLKALAARDNGVPFYVALPLSTIDWSLDQGCDIPIEERSETEVTHITGQNSSGAVETVRVVPEGSRALNLAFDVTPARLVTALITERGAMPRKPRRSAKPLSRSVSDTMTDPNAAIPDLKLRRALIEASRELVQRGLAYGTSGNISVRRDEQRFFISPSGMPPDVLDAR